jgi:hypothetical protein
LAVLWTQHRCSRVSPNTLRRAAQKPNAPSPIASVGPSAKPRAFRSNSNCKRSVNYTPTISAGRHGA